MTRILSLAFGALALLTTTSVLCTQILLALHIDKGSPGRSSSIVSTIFESAVLALVGWRLGSATLPWLKVEAKPARGVVFGLGIILCAVSAITSIIALVYLGKATESDQSNILVAASVVLGLSLPSQLIFLVVDFVSAASESIGGSWSLHKDEESSRSHKISLKAIRYSQTFPKMSQAQAQGGTDSDTRGLSESSAGGSAIESIRSSITSVSQAIRPTPSKIKTLVKEKHRSRSVDSFTNGSSSGDDPFDTWDTSGVDVHNRQAVLEISTPTSAKFHSLETIPASPMGSRSPTPDPATGIGLSGVQVQRQSSRCYSPVSLQHELFDLPTPGAPGSNSEAHIHPLFRSDSPDPPPLATPGTSVIAAPDAARVLVHSSSSRSLNRMRSGSLPVSPSPLSKQGSFEDSRSLRFQKSDLGTIMALDKDDPNARPGTERKMTPPVPEWLLRR